MLYFGPPKFQSLLLTIRAKFYLAKSTNFILAFLWSYRKIDVYVFRVQIRHISQLDAIEKKTLNTSVKYRRFQKNEKNIYMLAGILLHIIK